MKDIALKDDPQNKRQALLQTKMESWNDGSGDRNTKQRQRQL